MQKGNYLTVLHQTMRGMEPVLPEWRTPLPEVILCHRFTANKLQEHLLKFSAEATELF